MGRMENKRASITQSEKGRLEQRAIRDQLRQHDGINRETNALMFMALFTMCGTQVSSADKIQSVEWKATAISGYTGD